MKDLLKYSVHSIGRNKEENTLVRPVKMIPNQRVKVSVRDLESLMNEEAD